MPKFRTTKLEESDVKSTMESTSNFGKKLGVAMVDIFVGPSNDQFHVHKDLLCAKVPYFEKMFRSEFKEAKDNVATLPEDDPGAFSLLLEWVYGGKFLEFDPEQSTRDSGPIIDRIELYGLSEKLVLPTLMDYTATSILSGYERLKYRPSLEGISALYRCTTSRAPMRWYMAMELHRFISQTEDSLSSHYSTRNISQAMLESEDLTQDLMQLMRGPQKASPDPKKLRECTFHIHSKEHNCGFTTCISE